MKIIKKIGTLFIGLITCIQTFCYKVYANYRLEVGPLYGVEKPPKSTVIIRGILGNLKFIIIPIILLIGFIVYIEKSKNDKYKNIVKIAILITSILIFAILILSGIMNGNKVFTWN